MLAGVWVHLLGREDFGLRLFDSVRTRDHLTRLRYLLSRVEQLLKLSLLLCDTALVTHVIHDELGAGWTLLLSNRVYPRLVLALANELNVRFVKSCRLQVLLVLD